MRELLEQLVASKRVIAINFSAAAGGKLISANGTLVQVGDDYVVMQDIYGNTMIIPLANVAYFAIQK